MKKVSIYSLGVGSSYYVPLNSFSGNCLYVAVLSESILGCMYGTLSGMKTEALENVILTSEADREGYKFNFLGFDNDSEDTDLLELIERKSIYITSDMLDEDIEVEIKEVSDLEYTLFCVCKLFVEEYFNEY